MTSISRPLVRRTLVGLAATALAVTGTLTTSGPATAAGPAKAADRGSAWLAGEFENNMFASEFDGVTYPDWGLTVDAALALAAAGNRPDKLDKVAGKLENNYDDYTSYEGTVYGGPAAKMLTAAKVFGADHETFAERNVRRVVLDLVADDGELVNSNGTGAGNTFSQSFAVIGLSRSGLAPVETVDFLLRQQCADGYFRLYITDGQTCDEAGDSPSVDASAMAIQALVAAKADGLAVPRAKYKKAVSWLLSAQGDNGAFGSDEAITEKNTNSTGLAAAALQALGKDNRLGLAQDWISSVQLTKAAAGDGPAKKDLGAIAYSRAAFRTAKQDGVDDGARDQFRRASAQGILALAGTSLVTLRR